jgi:hypothetical protein
MGHKKGGQKFLTQQAGTGRRTYGAK